MDYGYASDSPVYNVALIYAAVHVEWRLSHPAARRISDWFREDNTFLYLQDMHILFVSEDHRLVCEATTEPVIVYRIPAQAADGCPVNHSLIYFRGEEYIAITSWPATTGERGVHLHQAYYDKQFRTGPRPTYWFAMLEAEEYERRSRATGIYGSSDCVQGQPAPGLSV